MKQVAYLITASFMMAFFAGPSVSAENPNFTVTSMVANYYIDRDKNGVSNLAAEEVFSVIFPSSGASFSGFSGVIPTKYLKKSNDLKVTGVNGSGGQTISYSTSYDSNHDLVLNIGDPSITVFGSQSYFIRYQARGIINVLNDHQEFYPNFNGRGWEVPFGQITGVIHMPNSLVKELKSQPICLIDSGKCEVKKDTKDANTVYTVVSANSLPAHQSLTAKFDFKKDTFSQASQPSRSGYILKFLLGLIILTLIGRTSAELLRKRKAQKRH